jgi:sterol desaturase/sphingolipid hydroxylase (fatty acid hydroxylase superfamily)
MQNVVDFFATFPSSWRTVLLVSSLAAFWVLEGLYPLLTLPARRVRHALLNLSLTTFQIVIALSLSAAVVATAQFTTQQQWGLLQVLRLPVAAQIVGGLLLLDLFGGYIVHLLEHRIPWLWRFHVVHHTDTSVDVTTGLRHHPVETLIRIASQWLAIVIGGIPVGVVLMYQIVSVFFAQLTHANIGPWPSLDRFLSLVLVTPNMHKVHHHYKQPLTDTNYGNVLSIWDRLFGSFAAVPPERLTYGIDSIPAAQETDRLGSLLTLPFRSPAAGPDQQPDADA